MSMICPKCQSTFQQRLQCPQCGGRLEYQAGGRSLRADQPGEKSGGWQETPWGRIMIGLLLAQGLYYGLVSLGNAGLTIIDPEQGNAFWTSMTGLIVLQVLQALGLVIGGALGGAGKQRGLMFGALVGVWNSLIFLIIQALQKQQLTPIALYGQPLMQIAFGAIGGAIGQFIWKPLKPVVDGGSGQGKGAPAVPRFKGPSPFAGPIAWVRVLIGTAVTVAGTLSAAKILDSFIDASNGKFGVDTHLEARMITWEITALAAIIGSALAGAATRNGMKQGLCVGILAGVVLFGLSLGQPQLNFLMLVVSMFTPVVLGLAGGWFGGNLFPPTVKSTSLGSSPSVPQAV